MKIFALCIVLVVVLILITMVMRRSKKRSTKATRPGQDEPDTPVNFGYQCSRLAIRSTEPKKVIEALTLEDVVTSSWRHGVDEAYSGLVFVTEPIAGWILVVSSQLGRECADEDPEKEFNFIKEVANKFPEVQYFATHRTVEFHVWVRYVDGNLTRAYAYDGEQGTSLWNVGELTPEEHQIILNHEDQSQQVGHNTHRERSDHNFPNEGYVMLLAEKWSINPQNLESLKIPPSLGYLGYLPIEFQENGEPRHSFDEQNA